MVESNAWCNAMMALMSSAIFDLSEQVTDESIFSSILYPGFQLDRSIFDYPPLIVRNAEIAFK